MLFEAQFIKRKSQKESSAFTDSNFGGAIHQAETNVITKQ
jgi:hypothetical protein